MFRVIDLTPGGKPEESKGDERACPPPPGTFRWVDLLDWDEASLETLRERFGFHPLEIEDCASFELHSKLEEYPDHLFVVLNVFTEDPHEAFDIEVHEIHAFVNEDYLVTVHDRPVAAADAVWARARTDPRILESPGWALYATADAMVDAAFPFLDKIARELERVESAVLANPTEEELGKVFRLRSTLVSMRRVVRPLRDVIGMLSRRKAAPLSKRTALYFRDVYDHVLRTGETIEEAQGLVESAVDAYKSAIANRTNEIMTKLTVFSVVFLPLAVLTGFWGQNFAHLPINSEAVFYVNLGIIVGLPASLLWWFRTKGWL